MPYIRETTFCGRVIEVRKIACAVLRKTTDGRMEKHAKTSEAKKKINDRNAERTLRQKLNLNFGPDDLFLTMTYKGDAPDPEEAAREVGNWIRRMQREYKKLNSEMKYIAVTEYKAKRIHHHIVMSRIEGADIMKAAKRQWRRGRVDLKMLDASGDFSQLASYLIKETTRTFREEGSAQGKRWKCSRNLKEPEHKREEISAKTWKMEPRPPKGYILDKYSYLVNQWAIGSLIYDYQEYRFIKLPEKKAGKGMVYEYVDGDFIELEPEEMKARSREWRKGIREGKAKVEDSDSM